MTGAIFTIPFLLLAVIIGRAAYHYIRENR